jgi:hypothetical protein
MNAAAIIIIAIAATGVLMMRFRRRWLAKINIAFTNRITGVFAGWLPGFGILTHVGSQVGKGLPDTSECFSSVERLHHRAHLQQPIRVGEERPCGGRLRTKDSWEEISAFRAACGARSYATAIPDSGARGAEDRGRRRVHGAIEITSN